MKLKNVFACLLFAGGIVSSSGVMAAQIDGLNNLGLSWPNIHLRGGEKTGAAGYERILPPAQIQYGQTTVRKPIELAQSSDSNFRVNQLEEQIRHLNGQVEDMTFQLLQMQEQIRKMQEDNEFRFQELEDQSALKHKNKNKTASKGKKSLGKLQPSDPSPNKGSGGNRKTISELLNSDTTLDQEPKGEGPINLGTLTFDGNGNVVDSNIGRPIELTPQAPEVAGLPQDPRGMFDIGYQYVQGGRYNQAESVFQKFVTDFPTDPKISEAKFWLGESYFSQGRYQDAAKVFLQNHKENPSSVLGPQNLLKLGVSLAGLDQRELACATYAEVPKKYPNISNSMRKRIVLEQKAAKCKTGG